MMGSKEDDVVTCRSCISECTEYRNIHRDSVIMGEQTNLAALLSYCTDLSFPDDEDFMPDNMCTGCITNLYNFYAFKQTVIKVDQRLRWEHNKLFGGSNGLGKLEKRSKAESDGQQQHLNHRDEPVDSTYSDDHLEEESGKQKIYAQKNLELDHLKVEQQNTESNGYCDSTHDSQHNGSESSSASSESEDDCQRLPEIESKRLQSESVSGFQTKEFKEIELTNNRVRNTDTKYACEICNKSYRQRGSLLKHLQTHQGEKPFLCDICGKGISQKSGYKKHMLTHTGEKPHTCDICGRDFRYSSNLIIHKRRHAGERRFNCTLCEKSFYTTEKLRRHMKTHDRDGIFNCEECGKQFRFRNTLKEHLRTYGACMRRKMLGKADAVTTEEDN